MTYKNLSIPFVGLFFLLLGYKLDGSNFSWLMVLSPLWGYCFLSYFVL